MAAKRKKSRARRAPRKGGLGAFSPRETHDMTQSAIKAVENVKKAVRDPDVRDRYEKCRAGILALAKAGKIVGAAEQAERIQDAEGIAHGLWNVTKVPVYEGTDDESILHGATMDVARACNWND